MTNFGWHKDVYNSKDYPPQPYRYGAAQVPDVVDLSYLLPPRLDQDGMNGCVGAALSQGISACLNSQNAPLPQSWIWPWNGARALEGTLSQNVGVCPRDAFDWLLKQGCLEEMYWPFSGKFDAAGANTVQMAKAIKYKDFAYFRVGDGAQGIMECLAESEANMKAGGPGWLVCMGSPYPDKWMKAPEGILPDIIEKDITDNTGGHEYIIYGYSQISQRLFMANSWSPKWGLNGCAYMPYSALPVFKKMGGYDAQYLRFTASPVPPGPVVEKTGCNPLANLMGLFKRS